MGVRAYIDVIVFDAKFEISATRPMNMAITISSISTAATIESLRILPQNTLKALFLQWVGVKTRAFNKTYLARKIVEAMEAAKRAKVSVDATVRALIGSAYIPPSRQLTAAPKRARRATKRTKSTNNIVAIGYTLLSGSLTQLLRVNADNAVTKRFMKQLEAGDNSVIEHIASPCRDRQRKELALVLHTLQGVGFSSLQAVVDWSLQNPGTSIS